MASQSLYRRYRPRRFAEIKGQDHVVRALRDSVAGGREGQAYLFSGPRGTGKTTSARILAKVLNCERPVDGEPCCECPSCLDVERGASYDVHELDAASNNGVDAMRDLIDKAQLGTPGRHKVYILDEVHMLSKPAEAALLKTLEEPPDHVVFVLATTDPQKVSDTIRSRTQHLRFHLLPPDVLADHVRWVASDAGLELADDAISAAVSQGAGSARDALSALELIASSGGNLSDQLRFDEVVDALIDHDPGQALTAVARLVNAGHDPRTVAEELVRHLRNGFLSLMAPELVQSPSTTVDALAAQAQRLGAAALVAAIERLGGILVELRHAPDPRVLVEVALVQLTRAGVSDTDDGSGLAARVAKLERAVASGAGSVPQPPPAPVDPATGRAKLGGRAQRAAADAVTQPNDATSSGARPSPPATSPIPPTPTSKPTEPETDTDAEAAPTASRDTSPAAPEVVATGDPPAGLTVESAGEIWTGQVRPALKGLVRALFAPVELVGVDGDTITLAVPNATHRDKCEGNLADVQQRWTAATGSAVRITWSLQPADGTGPIRRSEPSRRSHHDSGRGAAGSPGGSSPSGTPPQPDEVDEVDEIDEIDESRPALAGGVSALDRIAEAFPGAERVETDD